MSTTNIFELASRQKLRFPSIKGELTTEQLWDLPLQSKSGFDLDTIAKGVNHELKTTAEESFVATSTNPAKARLELQLEVVKHVIGVRMAENEAKQSAAARASERERLESVLQKKEGEELEKLTPDQIKERIAKLGG